MSASSSSRRRPRCAGSATPPIACSSGAALGFDAVAALAPYLDALGVSDAYLSPCFRCGPGSSHGYDVTDHNAFNPELGGAATFDRHGRRARRARPRPDPRRRAQPHGHRGRRQPLVARRARERPQPRRAPASSTSTGRRSSPSCATRCSCPSCPISTAACSRRGSSQLELRGRRLLPALRGRAPAASTPDTYPQILGHRLEPSRSASAPSDAGLRELRSILTALEHLPGRTETDPARIEERLREKEIVKRRLAALVQGVGGDPRARRGDGARLQRHPRRSGELRPSTASCPPRPTGSPTGAWRATRSTTAASST